MARHPEYQYLDLLETIMAEGDPRMDRTGVGTKAIFASSMKFDISDGTIPILTTKRIYWKTAIKELLWFLSGDTNIRSLLQANVKIWTDWPLAAYRKATADNISQDEFEARILADDAFASKWGEISVYGKYWRRWQGADGRTHDQIADVIDQIKNNPASRRLLFHGWNVAELQNMALPPCHLLYQYNASSTGKLNSLMFQRSADTYLGLGWNLLSSCALQMMIAQQTGLELGQFTWFGGDVHLYNNHVEQAREQIKREPRPFPKLRLLRKPDTIDGYRIEDFEVVGYDPHPALPAPVAV